MKIKGYRFECETCHNLASIQVFYRKDGSVGYSRARHLGENKKFYYHQQRLEYVNTKLRELCNIDHGQDVKDKSIDQTKPESNPITKSVAGGEGFDPAPCK